MHNLIYSVIYSCYIRSYHLDTDFIVSTWIRGSVREYRLVNEKICKQRIKGKTQNILIVSAHVPTEEKQMKCRTSFKTPWIKPIVDVVQMT